MAFTFSLLQGDQDQDESTARFQRGHRLAEDGALGLLVIKNLHGVPGDVGCGQKIAGPDGRLRGIHLAVDAPGQRNGSVPVGRGSILPHQHAGIDAAGAGDDAGHGPVVGAAADLQITGPCWAVSPSRRRRF